MLPTSSVKAQPWKPFLSTNNASSAAVFEDASLTQGSIRLRVEADDKGGLGG